MCRVRQREREAVKLEEAVVGSMQIGNRTFQSISVYSLRLTWSYGALWDARRVSNALQRLRRKRRVRYDRKWQEWRLR